MALVFIASMMIGIVRQYPTFSNGSSNIRAFAGGCGLADDVLVEPDTNAGFMPALPGDYGSLGPLGGTNPVGFSPNGIPDHTVAEAVVMHPNQPGTDYDWDAPTKLKTPGSTARRCRYRTALTRNGFRYSVATPPVRSSRASWPRRGISCRPQTTAIRWWW